MTNKTKAPGSAKRGGPKKQLNPAWILPQVTEQSESATKTLLIDLAITGEISETAACLLIEALHLEAA